MTNMQASVSGRQGVSSPGPRLDSRVEMQAAILLQRRIVWSLTESRTKAVGRVYLEIEARNQRYPCEDVQSFHRALLVSLPGALRQGNFSAEQQLCCERLPNDCQSCCERQLFGSSFSEDALPVQGWQDPDVWAFPGSSSLCRNTNQTLSGSPAPVPLQPLPVEFVTSSLVVLSASQCSI